MKNGRIAKVYIEFFYYNLGSRAHKQAPRAGKARPWSKLSEDKLGFRQGSVVLKLRGEVWRKVRENGQNWH